MASGTPSGTSTCYRKTNSSMAKYAIPGEVNPLVKHKLFDVELIKTWGSVLKHSHETDSRQIPTRKSRRAESGRTGIIITIFFLIIIYKLKFYHIFCFFAEANQVRVIWA